MALNFPSSPSVNQLYTTGSYTWVWDGASWITGTQYTASLYGTASWSINSITADTSSYAVTASYALNGGSGGGSGGITSQQVLGLFIAYPSRMI